MVREDIIADNLTIVKGRRILTHTLYSIHFHLTENLSQEEHDPQLCINFAMKVISVLFSTLICGEILFNLDAEQVSTKVYSYREWKVNGSTLREVLVPMFSCSKDEDCSVQRNIKSSSCILVDWHGKSCGCESTHVPQIDEEGTFIGCLEKANKLHDPCVENIQCSTVDMEYVECKRLGKCGCVHGAITDPKTGRCLVGASMGGPCSSDESCQLLTLLSICNKTSSQCSCPQNRFYNEENKIRSCEERARKIGDKCDFFYEPISPFQRGKRYNCDLIKGAECDIFTRTCTCRDMVPVYFPESSAMACGFDFDLTSMNRFALSPDRGWYMAVCLTCKLNSYLVHFQS